MRQQGVKIHKSDGRTPHHDSLIIGSYIVSFESQRHYERLRYYWMICMEAQPEELVMWGHASTRHLAVLEARSALEKLLIGSASS